MKFIFTVTIPSGKDFLSTRITVFPHGPSVSLTQGGKRILGFSILASNCARIPSALPAAMRLTSAGRVTATVEVDAVDKVYLAVEPI